jgi:hypothetical protein
VSRHDQRFTRAATGHARALSACPRSGTPTKSTYVGEAYGAAIHGLAGRMALHPTRHRSPSIPALVPRSRLHRMTRGSSGSYRSLRVVLVAAARANAELRSGGRELVQARKESLVAQLAAADAPPPLLHATLAALYREKVARWRRRSRTQTAVLRPLRPCAVSWTPSCWSGPERAHNRIERDSAGAFQASLQYQRHLVEMSRCSGGFRGCLSSAGKPSRRSTKARRLRTTSRVEPFARDPRTGHGERSGDLPAPAR